MKNIHKKSNGINENFDSLGWIKEETNKST